MINGKQLRINDLRYFYCFYSRYTYVYVEERHFYRKNIEKYLRNIYRTVHLGFTLR